MKKNVFMYIAIIIMTYIPLLVFFNIISGGGYNATW